MDHAASSSIPQDLENLDLLRNTNEISVAEDEHRLRISSMLRKSKLGSKSKGYSRKEEKSISIPYEKQKLSDDYHPHKETPFQEIYEDRGCKEFMICGFMTLILLLALFALAIVIVYLALHPATPTIAVLDVRNGTLSLVTSSSTTDTNANQTAVGVELVLVMQATNPRPKAFTSIHYRNGTLIIGYQKDEWKAISTPSFDQPARNGSTIFIAHLPLTQLRIAQQTLQNASLEFYQKNVSLWVTGTVRADFKILNLLSPHATVSINCSLQINPIDIWTGRPGLLSKACL